MTDGTYSVGDTAKSLSLEDLQRAFKKPKPINPGFPWTARYSFCPWFVEVLTEMMVRQGVKEIETIGGIEIVQDIEIPPNVVRVVDRHGKIVKEIMPKPTNL